MSKTLNLNLSKETLLLEMSKEGVDVINPCQVSFQLDVSGSFHDSHRSGYTNTLLARILPFALLFDKDGVLDMFSFSTTSEKLKEVTQHNYQGYVKNHVMTANNYNGWSTNYLTAFKDLVNNGFKKPKPLGFFGKFLGGKEGKPESIGKHLSFFVTDGLPNDGDRAIEYFKANVSEEHFIVFISISNSDIRFLEGNFKSGNNTDYFNMSPAELSGLQNVSDEDLYKMFLTPSLIKWMNK